MVHALYEIRRVLRPEGALIDLRPMTEAWAVEVVSARDTQRAGSMTVLPQGPEDDAAATGAMHQGESKGLFVREHEELFPIYYYWDSPGEMKEWVEAEWDDTATIAEALWKNMRSLWATAEADARIRVRLTMLITRWRVAQ